MKASAFDYLIEEQKSHRKVKHMKYDKLDIQPYLSSPLFNRKDKS